MSTPTSVSSYPLGTNTAPPPATIRRFVLALTAVFASAASLCAANYYVNAATGSDDAAGTSPGAPFKTISRALTVGTNTSFSNNYARPGDTVIVADGTYPESIIPNVEGNSTGGAITIMAANTGKAIVEGAVPLSASWTRLNSSSPIYFMSWASLRANLEASTGLNLDAPTYRVKGGGNGPSGARTADSDPIFRREQLIINGKVMRAVFALNQMEPNTMFVDGSDVAQTTIYTWVAAENSRGFINPNSITISEDKPKFAVHETLFNFGNRGWINLIGLNFRYSCSPAQSAMVVSSELSHNLRIENCVAESSNSGGFKIRGIAHFVVGNTARDNGQIGLGASSSYGGHFEENYVIRNNVKRYSLGFEGGGGKISGSSDNTFHAHHAAGNYGPGLWLDLGNKNNFIENSVFYNNSQGGLMLESQTQGTIVRNNVLAYNRYANESPDALGAGLMIQVADKNLILHNTIFGNDAPGIWVKLGGPRNNNSTTDNNRFYKNWIGYNSRVRNASQPMAEVKLSGHSTNITTGTMFPNHEAEYISTLFEGNVYYLSEPKNAAYYEPFSAPSIVTSGSGLAEWQLSGRDTGNLAEENIKLIDDFRSWSSFHLRAGSRAAARSTSLPGWPTTELPAATLSTFLPKKDIDEVTRATNSAGKDAGADEYAAGGGTGLNAPTISTTNSTTISIQEDSYATVHFEVGDATTAPADLTVTARSDAPQVIPDPNLVVAFANASGSQRLLTITPRLDRFTAEAINVLVSVTDGYNTATLPLTVTIPNTVDDFTLASNVTQRVAELPSYPDTPNIPVPGRGGSYFVVRAHCDYPDNITYQWKMRAKNTSTWNNVVPGDTYDGTASAQLDVPSYAYNLTTQTVTRTGVIPSMYNNEYMCEVFYTDNGGNPSNVLTSDIYTFIPAFPVVSFNNGVYVVTQNFDSLPSTGSFNVSSDGPFDLSSAWGSFPGYGTLKGWQVMETTPSGANLTLSASNGAGGTLLGSFGSNGSSERALGSRATPGATYAYGVVLLNTGTDTVTDLQVSYYGEQWRRGDGTSPDEKLTFGYRTTADVTAANIGGAPGLYKAATLLDFTAPNYDGSGDTAINGNNNANRTYRNQTLTDLGWKPGDYLVLRWTDKDDPSDGDHTLAIDDITITKMPSTSGGDGGTVAPVFSTTTMFSTTVTTGTTTFTPTLSAGTTPIFYYWLKDGQRVLDGVQASGATALGTVASSLSLSGLTPADSGDYTLRAVNKGGNATSRIYRLTVP